MIANGTGGRIVNVSSLASLTGVALHTVYSKFIFELLNLSDIVAAFNSLQPGVAYLYPLKTSEPKCFLMFSEGIDKQRQVVMG